MERLLLPYIAACILIYTVYYTGDRLIDLILNRKNLFQDTNVLGFKGPRKMTILLPKDSSNYYKQADSNNEVSLTGLNKIDPKSVIKLKNKTPVWNEETQSYVLNFKVSSIRRSNFRDNFSLVLSF